MTDKSLKDVAHFLAFTLRVNNWNMIKCKLEILFGDVI